MYFPQDLKYDSILCRFVLAIALHLEVSVAFVWFGERFVSQES